MIRTILFDMGNVLVHFSHERMCEQMAQACGIDTETMHRRLFEGGLLIEFECGRLNADEFRRQLLEEASEPVDLDVLRVATSNIFQLNRGMPAILDALRERGIRLVLMSNTSVWHYEWVKSEFDILDRFDASVTSFEAGAIKPDAGIFESALGKIDCAPEECFYTDDIPAYVETGRNFGFDGEVFTNPDNLRQHLSARGMTLH